MTSAQLAWPDIDTSPITTVEAVQAEAWGENSPASSEATGAALSFAEYANRANSGKAGLVPLMEYEHIPRLVRVADKVVSTFEMSEGGEPAWQWKPGEPNYKRVLVLLAPRYFKSEVFSRLLPAYFLSRFPNKHVGLASYSADLAWKLSGNARDYFRKSGGQTKSDTDAKKLWQTAEGGEMWAAGIDGSITGSGFHLGVIDDPMKPKHARSNAYVEAFRSFYPDTWYNRQEPGAAMIVVMQRLGQQDPIDFLYRREVGDDTDEAPEHWHVVCCDEIKSDEPLARYDGVQGLPETCTLEPDPRQAGEILAPSRFDRVQVSMQQRAAGFFSDAQRQQRPGKPSGDVWKAHWFATYGTEDGDPIEQLPPGAYNRARDWDTAYTKNKQNSATAQVETSRLPSSSDRVPIYISDVDWRWLEAPERLAWMNRLGGKHHIEAKATGKSDVQLLRDKGSNADEVKVDGDKYMRTSLATARVTTDDEEGKMVDEACLFVHASLYHKLLFDEQQGLLTVTKQSLLDGKACDVNDVVAQAIARHTKGNKKIYIGSKVFEVN